MSSLVSLCLTELAKQYVDTDSNLEKEAIAQQVPTQLIHQFVVEVQKLELKPITELVHTWADHVDSWCYCTNVVRAADEFTEVTNDMLQFVRNPRKRLLEAKISWTEWERDILSKLTKNSSVSDNAKQKLKQLQQQLENET